MKEDILREINQEIELLRKTKEYLINNPCLRECSEEIRNGYEKIEQLLRDESLDVESYKVALDEISGAEEKYRERTKHKRGLKGFYHKSIKDILYLMQLSEEGIYYIQDKKYEEAIDKENNEECQIFGKGFETARNIRMLMRKKLMDSLVDASKEFPKDEFFKRSKKTMKESIRVLEKLESLRCPIY